jgi:hypothetical protein
MAQVVQQQNVNQQANMVQMQMLGQMSQQMALLTTMNSLLTTLNQGFNTLTRAIIENTRMLTKMSVPGGPGALRYEMWQKSPMAGIAGGGKAPSVATSFFMNLIDENFNNMLKDMAMSVQQFGGLVTKPSGISGKGTAESFTKHGYMTADPREMLTNMFKRIDLTRTYSTGIRKEVAGPFGGMVPGSVVGTTTRGNLFPGLAKQVKQIADPFKGAMMSMGPQMAMMALVMAPVSALLEGLFEPFEMITEIFGAYGQVLGQMFYPILLAIQPILLSFLPILQALAPMFGQLILVFFQFLTPIGLLLPILTAVMPFLTIGIQYLSGIIEQVAAFLTNLKPLELIFYGLLGVFMDFPNVLSNIGNFFTVTIPGFFTTMINNLVGLFTGIGTTIAEIITDLWTEIKSLGTTKTKWFN